MPPPTTISDFLGLIRKSGLIDEQALADVALDLPLEPAACAAALVEAERLTAFQAKQLLAGRIRGLVLGPYRILRPLGQGGMGAVFLAEHTDLVRRVAIKVLGDEQAKEELALGRFFREARAAAALDHPNIVRLHDIGRAGGTHYLVMEFVDGTDLQALVERTGPLHYAQAAGYIAQAASGLQHAHEMGFIHRDIKPANLIVSKSGVVKVLDMGLARSVTNPKDALTSQLGDNGITGTIDYLSPEQARNVSLDARTDIYSLGAAFYSLLTGRPPYGGSTGQKLARHQMAVPPDVRAARPDVPVELSAVIARMMAKHPDERYQTANDVIAALAPWAPSSAPTVVSVQTGADTTTCVGAPVRPNRFRRVFGSRLMWAVLGCTGALVFAGLLQAVFVRSKPDTQPPPAPVPEPGVGAPVAVDRSLYSFDMSVIPSFTVKYQNGQLDDPSGGVPVPIGLLLHCWKKESVAEFRGGAESGRPWVGVTNLSEEPTSQIIFQFDEGLNVSLVPGRRYRVRLEYKTWNEAGGGMHIRNPKGDEFPSLTHVRLDRTGDKWHTAEATFRRPADGKIDVCISNSVVGEGNMLAIRSLDVFEADSDK